MRCQWSAFINLLPTRLRGPVDRNGREDLLELRLRIGQKPELLTMRGSVWLNEMIGKEDIQFCINAASQYSPWSASGVTQGYITAPGGHRLGLCGAAVIKNGCCVGLGNVSSLCIRVARDIANISKDLACLPGSVLLIGPPGSGKTTLLRDLIRTYSESESGSVAVVDERGELFPYFQNEPCFPTGRRTDIMTGYSKKEGITILLRCMGPGVIAMDEITAEEDCQALLLAAWCGVRIFATAHAADLSDLHNRKVYKPIMENGVFDNVVILRKDKSWTVERMKLCI